MSTNNTNINTTGDHEDEDNWTMKKCRKCGEEFETKGEEEKCDECGQSEEGWECCEGCQQYFDTRTESTKRCGKAEEYGYYHASCWFHHDECRECKYQCYEEEEEETADCDYCGFKPPVCGGEKCAVKEFCVSHEATKK